MEVVSTTLKASTPEYSSWSPSYAELPMEIILQIFRFLHHSDLQMAGATCTRWREALMSTQFTNMTVVHFTKSSLADGIPPGKDFLKCERPLRNFYLEEVVFGEVEKIMAHMGKYATKITFDSAEMTDKRLFSLIRRLPNLSSLTILRCSNLFMTGSFLENNEDRDFVEDVLSNVHHLTIRHSQYLSDRLLLLFTHCMKRINTLDLCGCHITYHAAIQKRFYPTETTAPSENILTFKYVLRVITLHQDNLLDLNLSQTLMNAQSVFALAALPNGGLKLQRLRLAKCRQVNALSMIALIKTLTQLQLLDLSDTVVNDDCIRALITHTPLLRVLRLAGCNCITNDGAMLLGQLKHLQHLDISRCDSISSEGILHGIAATYSEAMRELHMSCLQVCEECVVSISRNLPELRVLNLGHCVNGVTDYSVQCVIRNLRWLRELSLEDCFRITDAAITGIQVFSLGIKESSPNSLGDFHPPPVSSIAEHESLNGSVQSMKISLRSKAEEEIVCDAHRKKAMLAAYEMNLINDCDIVGDNIQQLRGLKILNLRGCTKISDVSLKYGVKLLELQSLSLSNCQQISNVGMEVLVTHCPSIEELDLSDCYNINDRAIQVITSKLSRLRALHISGCTKLTDHSLDAILVNCKCLKTLSVYRCRLMYTDIEDRMATLATLRNLNMDNSPHRDNAEILRLRNRLDY